MFKISLSNILLLFLAVCVALGWYVDRRHSNKKRMVLESEREDLYQLLREQDTLARIYESSMNRQASTRIELDDFATSLTSGVESLDAYLDAHRRYVQATIAAKNAELNLIHFGDESKIEGQFNEFCEREYRVALRSLSEFATKHYGEQNNTQNQLSQISEQLYYYKTQILRNAE